MDAIIYILIFGILLTGGMLIGASVLAIKKIVKQNRQKKEATNEQL